VNNNVDLVIVPGLAFDISSNYRVGFGGGYYDRFLANYRGNTIALVPRAMKFEKADWDIEDHDIKIDKLITE
jgi:5-formyltetrahydrofolate cyclo-ligase